MNGIQLIIEYVKEGFLHVIPYGYDHILFISSLIFLNSNLKSVLIQCSVFTLAHSITLILTAAGILFTDSTYIEPIIALSIVFTALENLIHHTTSKWRLILIFIFGLIHGMGFANAFKELNIPINHFYVALLSFNLGVEFGQIFIILLLFLTIVTFFRHKSWYKKYIVYPISSLIACVAMYWSIERIFMN